MDWNTLFGKAKDVVDPPHAWLVETAAKNPKRLVNIVIGVVTILLIAVGLAYLTK